MSASPASKRPRDRRATQTQPIAEAAVANPHCRWRESESALAIIVAFTALKLALCPSIGLYTNEAYAIASGRFLSLGYFDHPPLHFWLAHLCELIFGDTRYARIPFILLGAGTSWLAYRLTQRLFGAEAGVWAVLALNLSIFFSLFSGQWILPDGPLNFFALAAALCVSPLALDERQLSLRRWLAAGALLGLAALSKYHAVLFAGGFFLFLVTSRPGRSVLGTPGPWLAALTALMLFAPVLYWNNLHDWISFRFQGGRAGLANEINPRFLLGLIAQQIGLISPWVALPLIGGVWRALRGGFGKPAGLLLWLGLPQVVFFSLAPLWSGGGQPDWVMPGWLLLMPLAGADLARLRFVARRRWLVISAALFFSFVALAAFEIQTGWLGRALPSLRRHEEPTAPFVDWRPLGELLERIAAATRGPSFVVASNWRDAAKIDQALGGRLPVVVAYDPRNFALGRPPGAFATALIVTRVVTPAGPSGAEVPAQLQNVTLATVAVGRGGQPEATFVVRKALGFVPSVPKWATRK